MKRKRIPLEELEPLYDYNPHSPDLVKKVVKEGWAEIPPIPAIEIPRELRTNGKKYCHSDGHQRHNAATVTNTSSLDCIVYGEGDDTEDVSRQTGNSELGEYTLLIKLLKQKRDGLWQGYD